MSDQPPVVGQDPWGVDLNTYLAGLEARIVALEAKPDWIFNSAAYQFSNAPPPATGSQVRLNNSNAALATQIDMRVIDSDGADRSAWLGLLNAGDFVRLADWNNAAVFYRFRVIGAAVFTATNAQIPVAWDSGSGTLPNTKCNVGVFINIAHYFD